MNLIFLVVDGLRQDVLNRLYKSNQLNGGLKFLLNNGVVCTDAYANSAPTQFSFPSIFTSTLPLDYGGYDYGILNRPKSFVEIFAANDYKCIGTAGGPWNSSLFGYNRGFSVFHDSFDINMLVAPIINGLYLSYYQNLLKYQIKTYEQVKEIRRIFIDHCYPYVETVILKRLNNEDPSWIYPWDYKNDILIEYLRKLRQFRESFDNNSIDVVDCKFPILPTKHSAYLHILDKESLLDEILRRVFRRLKINIKVYRNLGITFSKQLLDNFIKSYPFNNQQNQFHYLHLLDVHETVFSNNKYNFNLKTYLLSYSCKGKENYYYEESIKRLDRNLGNYFNKLLTKNNASKIKIVLIGDHGSYLGFPNKGLNLRNASDHIYHETINCAMIYYSPDLKAYHYNQSCSLLDVGPSILDLMGLNSDTSFIGQSIFKERKHDAIISENCGSGPCDLSVKPIYLSIKKHPFKLIYREFFHPNERIKNEIELYNTNDVYEEVDLHNDPNFAEVLAELKNIALERIIKIRSYSNGTKLIGSTKYRECDWKY